MRKLEDDTGRALVIDELQSGDSFAEYSILYQEPLEYTVVTTMPSTIMFIDKAEIQTIDEDMLWEFKAKCKPYPSEQEMVDQYVSKVNWKKYRSQVAENVLINKSLKKDFDARLRLPVITPRKHIAFRFAHGRASSTGQMPTTDQNSPLASRRKPLTTRNRSTVIQKRRGNAKRKHNVNKSMLF
jgi:CRP-like cAMP-binding protein